MNFSKEASTPLIITVSGGFRFCTNDPIHKIIIIL